MKVKEIVDNSSDITLALHDDASCDHTNIHIEKACCSMIEESGYIECECGGRDNVVCDNPACDGIDEFEIELFYEKLIGGGSDCE